MVVVAKDVVDAVEAGLVSEARDHCVLTVVPTGYPGAAAVPTGRPGAAAVLTGQLGATAVLIGCPGVREALVGRPGVREALVGCRGENRGVPAAARCVIGRCRPSEVLCR